MKNLYSEIYQFSIDYLKNENLNNFLEHENPTYEDFNKFNENSKLNSYFKSIDNFQFPVDIIVIKEKKSNFIESFFEADKIVFNQICSVIQFINDFFNEEKFIKKDEIIIKFFKDKITLLDKNLNLNIIIKEEFFQIFNINFNYEDYENFPSSNLLKKLKSLFINKLHYNGVDTKDITIKKINEIYNYTPINFLNSVNKLKNFNIKSNEQIESIINQNGKYFVNNTHFFKERKDYDLIKLIFKEILDVKNYSYFCQSIDLFYFYAKYIIGDNKVESSFSTFLNKFPKTNYCYSISMGTYIDLSIGLFFNHENLCCLLSYNVGSRENLSDNMYDFYIALLNQLKKETIKKLNKENITFNDIKLLQILNV